MDQKEEAEGEEANLAPQHRRPNGSKLAGRRPRKVEAKSDFVDNLNRD